MSQQQGVSPHQRWAQLRFAIIGPLLAAPPPPGELRAQLKALAQKHWRHPISGLQVQFSFSTLERWFYLARRVQDPVSSLRRRRREDAGNQRRLSAALSEVLKQQYRTFSGWSMKLHYDNLAERVADDPGLAPLPSYATVRRHMKAKGWHRRRRPRGQSPGQLQAERRLETREVRSYEVDHVGSLWRMPSSRLCVVNGG